MNKVRPNRLLSLLNRTDDALLLSNLSDYSAERHAVLQRAGEPTKFVYFPHRGDDLIFDGHAGWRGDRDGRGRLR